MSIPSNKVRLAPLAPLAVGALVTLLLSGCADYLNHRDAITLAAGDAVQHNQAVHTIDPWPPGVFDTDISHNGARAERVINKFENPGTAKKNPTNVTVNVGDNAGASNSK